MKKGKILLWVLPMFMVFLMFQSVNIVKADDDEYDRDNEEHERYEGYERNHDEREDEDHDDRDDEEYEEDEEYGEYGDQSSYESNQTQQAYWNIWTRDTNTSVTEDLPVQEAKEIAVELNGKTVNLYVVPLNGQLLVSGEKMAKLLGIEYKFYKQSRIVEVSDNTEELIVRAGTNVAYENNIKTPMPANALYYEKSVYLPLSVMANAFGYRVNWNAEKGSIILEKI